MNIVQNKQNSLKFIKFSVVVNYYIKTNYEKSM